MNSPPLPPPNGRRSPLVTDDGFGDDAVVLDEATGCHLWQGDMVYRQPRARYRGAVVNPRLLAFARAYGPVPPGYRLDHCPRHPRCIRPDHQAMTLVAPRDKRPSTIREHLAGRLPAERPPHIRERDWAAITAVVAGKSYAEVGAALGVSRQRVGQMVARARRTLG